MKWMFLFLLPTLAFAKVKTEKVPYEKNGTKMIGLIAWDDQVKKPAPGVIVFHDWWGNGSFTEDKIKKLAAMGYVAFAADVYADGKQAKDVKEAQALSNAIKADTPKYRERVMAAYETVANDKRVNKDKIAAMGYCMGGTSALELAREGAPLKGVVTFHGGLKTGKPATAMPAKILILHGADDPFVPTEEVLAFQDEMRKVKADWQFISYGNTVHSFTSVEVDKDKIPGAAYNKLSDQRSWDEMKKFFKDTL